MVVQKVLLLACAVVLVSAVVHANAEGELPRSTLYRLAEEHIEKIAGRSSSNPPTGTKTVSLNPVHVPSSATQKPTDEPVSQKVVGTTKSHTESEETVVIKTNADQSKTKTNTYQKHKENPKHEEINRTAVAEQRETSELAEQKTGILTTGIVPFLASIGTALAIGGLAYYAYPVPELSARSDSLGLLNLDNGVKIVRPSELTPQELRRLKNAEAYHVNARSKSEDRKPHPYVNFTRRIYDYVVKPFLEDNSVDEQTNNDYDVGSLTHPYNAGQHIAGQHAFGQPILAQQNFGQPIMQHHAIGQPVVGQHVIGQPVVGQHLYGQQIIGHPHVGQPVFGQPNVG